MYTFSVITVSDKGSNNEREDISGKVIIDMLSDSFTLKDYIVIPDEEEVIYNTLIDMSDIKDVSLILTTGGTGFSKRDVTPEATKRAIIKETPGISEYIRLMSLEKTKRAILSRATSGIRNNTLIINLPGSPKAVKECIEFIHSELIHGLDILHGKTSECARK